MKSNGKYIVGSDILIKARVIGSETSIDDDDVINTFYNLEIWNGYDFRKTFRILEEDLDEIIFKQEEDNNEKQV